MRAGRHSREPPQYYPDGQHQMPPSSLYTEKTDLRRVLRQRRAALLPALRRQAERQAAQQARAAGWLRHGQRIAAYVPVGSEFSAWPLILLALKLGAEVYLPQVPKRGRRLRFVRLDQQTRWINGPYGIPEPQHAQQCSPQRLNTVFLPLVGFDAQGARLGQGGGYYDATFAFRQARRLWIRPRLIGLAFTCQQVAMLPLERWDVRLDTVLTGD